MAYIYNLLQFAMFTRHYDVMVITLINILLLAASIAKSKFQKLTQLSSITLVVVLETYKLLRKTTFVDPPNGLMINQFVVSFVVLLCVNNEVF